MQHTEPVAGAIRAALAEQRVGVDLLASWLGVSRSAASKKRNGRVPFTLADIRIIAEHLDVEAVAIYPDVVIAPKRSTYADRVA